jgi:ferric-dicitrate binding protein FerR (iron transport regulator)
MLLLERSASENSPADRLKLETHLAECESCADEAATLGVLTRAMREPSHELSVRQRQRAIERALRVATAPAPVIRPRARRSAFWLAAAACAVMLGALGFVLVLQNPPERGARIARLVTRAAQGAAESIEPKRGDHAEVTRDLSDIDAPKGTRLDLSGATIEALEPSKFSWHRLRSTVELVSGAVRVNVSRRFEPNFRVVTHRFAVEVVGTQFDVDLEGVSVVHGRVRVTTPSGDELLAELGPGDHFASSSSQKPATRAPAEVAADIARARRELAAGRVQVARALLTPLLRKPLEARQHAEASSLLAECARFEGDHEAAARAYEAVAKKHPQSLAGETALFAKARAELEGGRRDAARASFQRYLERYPDGRFRTDAERHLTGLKEQR